jgi:hypothetical protein
VADRIKRNWGSAFTVAQNTIHSLTKHILCTGALLFLKFTIWFLNSYLEQLSSFELKLPPNCIFFVRKGCIARQRTEVKIMHNIGDGFASCLESTF